MGKAFLYGVGGGAGGKEYILIEKTIDANGTYSAEEEGADGYSKVTVAFTTTEDDYSLMLNGTCQNLTVPGSITSIKEYAYYWSSSNTTLKTLTLHGGITTVGKYAFFNNRGLNNISIGDGVTSIGDYAFYYAGYNGSGTFELAPVKECIVGAYAFQYTRIGKLRGKLKTIGTYAFANCSQLTDVDLTEGLTYVGSYAFANNSKLVNINVSVNGNIDSYAFANNSNLTSANISVKGNIGSYAFYNNTKLPTATIDVTGSVGDYAFCNNSALTSITLTKPTTFNIYAFDGCYNLNNFTFDGSALTTIGSYAFRSFGSRRTSEEYLSLDFRKSKVTSIPTYCFIGTSSYYNKNLKVYLPNTVSTINAQAFQYNKGLRLYLSSVPTLSNTNAFANGTDNYIFIVADLFNDLLESTNWATVASGSATVVAAAYAGTYPVGEELPQFTKKGNTVTWYEDEALTIPATVVTDATKNYYGVVGAKERVGLSVSVKGCDVSVTDASGNVYTEKTGIPYGTTVTVTFIETVPENIYITKFTINGVKYTANFELVQNPVELNITEESENLVISASAGDLMASPDLAENGWESIAVMAESGSAAYLWNVGDEINVPINGVDYTFVILGFNHDDLADGTGKAGITFGMKNLYSNYYNMNTSNTNSGGWNACYMRNNTMPQFMKWLPNDLQAVIKTVKKYAANGTGNPGTMIASSDQLFLLSEYEVLGAQSYAGVEKNVCQRYAYYRDIANTSALRVKKMANGSGSAGTWWLRSPYYNYSSYFCFVGSNGNVYYTYASSSYGVALGFCI